MKYRCGRCGGLGHNARTCTGGKSAPVRKEAYQQDAHQQQSVLKPSSGNRDLRQIFNELNAKYFQNRLTATISWSRRSTRSKWGHYCRRDNSIVINIILSRPDVPLEVLKATVYHEMLHEDIPIERDLATGRRTIHGPEFKRRMRMFPGYKAIKRWKQEEGDKILNQNRKTVSSYKGVAVGRKVSFRGNTYTIVEIVPRKYKFPFIIQNERGTKYKASYEQILAWLIK